MRASWTLALALLCVAPAPQLAHAGDASSTTCRVSLPDGQPMANRAATISAMEQLPESCLKSLLVECDETAHQSLIDPGSAALCSMGYEALLHKTFGGSFGAMLAWWQQGRSSSAGP